MAAEEDLFLAYKSLHEAPVWTGALPANAFVPVLVNQGGAWRLYKYIPNPNEDPSIPPQIPPGSSGLDAWIREDGDYWLREDGGKWVLETQT